jgi:hypothetical protein
MNPLATVGEESVIFPVAPFHSAAPVMAGRGLSGAGCRGDHRAGAAGAAVAGRRVSVRAARR